MNALPLLCQCAGTCSVAVVTEWDVEADEHPEFAISIYEHVAAESTLRQRVKMTWAILRKRQHFLHHIIISREQGDKLRDFLMAGP